MELAQKVSRTIAEFGMLKGGERVGVGVSGGVDSIVLLELLEELRGELRLELFVLHLDHGIRGEESRRDLEFVRERAQEKGIPFFCREVDTPSYAKQEKLSLEEAARQLRYSFFEEAIRELGLERVALGHTADDQLETVLMALLRGSGIKGLKGMPPKRGPYIRPLIRIWRKEIKEYARKRGLRYVLDSSNLDPSFLRNRIRLQLLPLLEGFNPRIRERLLEMAEILREEDEALEDFARDRLGQLVRERGEGLRLDLEGLRDLPRGLASRVLSLAYILLSDQDLPYRHRRALLDMVWGGVRRMDLPGELLALKEGDTLYLGPEPKVRTIEEKVLLIPGVTVLEGTGMAIEAEVLEGPPGPPSPELAYLDLDKLHLPLTVRSPREGDRFVPSGMKGKKKLQDFFVDLKVPRHRRPQIPVVLSGGEICWVAGMRVDERFKATAETKRTLLLRLTGETP